MIEYSCGICKEQWESLDYMLFCQDCRGILCSRCVSEEIDSHYCPNCLENVASAEAILFKNRCKKCFCCPSCGCILGFATNPEEKYFLNCGYCRWTSLDSKLLLGASGGLEDNPLKFIKSFAAVEKGVSSDLQSEVSEIISTTRKIQREEKQNILLSKYSSRALTSSSSSTNDGSDEKAKESLKMKSMFGLSLPDLEKHLVDKEEKRKYHCGDSSVVPETIKEQENQEKVQNITAVNELTTLNQRYLQLGVQNLDPQSMLPQRKLLCTGKSKHCRKCDKLVVKRDLSVARASFKRLHTALSFVVRISLASKIFPVREEERQLLSIKLDDKIVMKKYIFDFCFTNPLDHTVNLIIDSVKLEHKDATSGKQILKLAPSISSCPISLDLDGNGETSKTTDAFGTDIDKDLDKECLENDSFSLLGKENNVSWIRLLFEKDNVNSSSNEKGNGKEEEETEIKSFYIYLNISMRSIGSDESVDYNVRIDYPAKK